MKMTISITTTTSSTNISNAFLLQFIMGISQGIELSRHKSGLMENELLTKNNTTPENLTEIATNEVLVYLLMPVWAYQSAGAYLTFISVVGLLMNILVVIVILNDPQRMTPLNFMLLNLACSDGMIAGFGTPISAAAAFQLGWPFSDELCVAYAMIMSTAGIGSIATLTALALWRWQLVVYCPAKRSGGGSSGNLSRVQAAILLTLIWAYSLAVTCPPLFGWGRYDREAAHISCSVNWESKMDNNRSYILYMFAFGLFVPLVAIICSYVSILRVVQKTGKFRRTMLATLQPTPQISDDAPTGKKPEGKTQSEAAERRVTVMVACMIGAFLAAWTPYSIMALFETFIGVGGHSSIDQTNVSSSVRQPEEEEKENLLNFVGAISPAFATIPSLFAKTSAILNPLIYGILNTQFRSAWEIFYTWFLSRQQHYQHHQPNNKYRHKFLNCADGGSPTMKRSTTVHLSLKEIESNESQSAYVIANTHEPEYEGITILLPKENQVVMEIRPEILSPSSTPSSCSMTNPGTPVSFRMTSFKNPTRRQSEEEQLEPQTAMNLVLVRLTSDSTTRSCINDDLIPQSTEESSI